MRARIDRLIWTSGATLGTLHLAHEEASWEWECYTREPPVRSDGVFIAGESALPIGLYTVSLAPSQRFMRVVPLVVSAQLLAAGGRRQALGMRIVPGHYTLDDDTGILVGQKQGPKDVHHTRQAFESLFAKFQAAKDRTEAIELEITQPERSIHGRA